MRIEALLAAVILGGIAVASLRMSRSSADDPVEASATFVFVKVPQSIMPEERGEKYEEPLDAALRREKLGEVTGGGTQLSEPDAEGRRIVEWVGLDVELTDLERGLLFLKQELLRLGAPNETTLEFERAGKRVTEAITG